MIEKNRNRQQYTILIVEDNIELSNMIAIKLEQYNYLVKQVEDFKKVEEYIINNSPDLILLDINLPYYNGFDICKNIRETLTTPIILISARDSEVEQIMGLEFGADDYIVKPFSMEILLAKIKSCLRRVYTINNIEDSSIKLGHLVVDKETFTMSYYNKKIELTKNEFKLILKLVENANKIVSRETLLSELWDDEVFVYDNTLTVNISRIKTKLQQIGLSNVIKTKRGKGYIFEMIH